MTTLEQMTDLKSRSRDTLAAMLNYSREMLTLSIDYVQGRLKEFAPETPLVTRALVATLDAHDSPASNDQILEAFKTRWPDLKVSEIVFDKQSNKFLIFTI